MDSEKEIDRVIWRPDLYALLGVGSSCVTKWLRDGKFPKPDVALSQKTMGWRMSTLREAGINLV